MNIPHEGQTVHLMSSRDVLRVLWKMRRTNGRTVLELALYTTDNLRNIYQTRSESIIRLQDGIINRAELVAVIRWRVWWERFANYILLTVSIIGALAALAGAAFALLAWRFPTLPSQ